jgi:hypothetical protein
MSDNKHITPYSASDIEKYRKGELSAREMHDLEQAALDDPFLADAIEGLTANPVSAEDLTDLHERLHKKVAEQGRRRKVIFLQRRITFAAATILLLGIGYTFFYHQPNQEFQATANLVKKNAPAAKAAPGTAAPAAEAAGAVAPATQKTAGDSLQYSVTQSLVQSKPSSPVLHYTRPASVSSKKAKAAEYQPSPDSTGPPARDDDHARGLAPTTIKQDTTNVIGRNLVPGLQYRANYFAPPAGTVDASQLVLNGKVLDFQNRPLAGAFLALNGKNSYGITTDEHGQFSLSLHPRDSTRQLTMSMIGYDHASFAINALSIDDQRNNIIRLRPSSANLDEVVVVGYGLHRNAAELGAPSISNEKLDTLWQTAAPVIGRQAYIQYLNVAKRKLGLDSTIAGPETLSFAIARDGTLSAFKIEHSLSPAHDAGIFRLVTDGPGWRLIRGKKVRASVTVIFP